MVDTVALGEVLLAALRILSVTNASYPLINSCLN